MVPPARRRRSARRAATVLLFALLATACASRGDGRVVERAGPTTAPEGTAAPADTSPEGAEGFVPDPIRWRGCGDGECATVEVPLDYDDPDGPTIAVAVVRVPAGGERRGALFVNPGGPGSPAGEFAVAMARSLPDEVTDHFDIVGVDPRGTGDSVAIDCGLEPVELYGIDPTVEDEADEAALVRSAEEYAADCEAEHGDLLAHLGTRDVARDHDAVRAAMGDDQLSFAGFSYGTVIGQVYAELFPHRVRAMVLDGVVELGLSGLELAARQAQGFELALDRWVAWCLGSDCAVRDDPVAAVEEVLALAEEGDGIRAPRADRRAGPGEATLALVYPLYARPLWDQLGDALAEALGGDGSRLVLLADAYLGLGDFDGYFAVNCIDFAWPRDPDAFFAAGKATAESSVVFGEAIVTDYIRCATWPVEPEPLPAVTAPDAPPILLVSTTGDPATPHAGAVATADRLASAALLTYEGDGHTVITDGVDCVDEVVVRYLVDLEPPDDGARC